MTPFRFAGWIFFCGLALFYFFLFSEPIDLTALDLGRHLANGRIFFEDFSIPSTNLYSYTHPDFPFVNHHWGSGVVFYGIVRTFGFAGLSFFAGALSVAAFFFFFHTAWRHGGLISAVLLSVLAIPLIAHRNDIRPELFSYLFLGAFFWILWNVREKRISERWLFSLPFLEMIWVNLHVYFILGVGLVGAFLAEAFISFFLAHANGERARHAHEIRIFFAALAATIGSALLNPSGAEGALVPFRIFGNYGYRVLENQSVWFIHRVLGFYPPSVFFILGFLVLCASWIVFLMQGRKKADRPSFALGALSLAFSLLGWLAIRNFTLFAYFMIPVAAINFRSIAEEEKTKETAERFGKTLALAFLVFFGLLLVNPLYWKTRGAFGLGLVPGTLGAISFFEENNMRGPIFNNYDIGGYLVYGLYPRERVFVDNRPEAYPASFFQDLYIPMQENDSVWKQELERFGFQAIVFYRLDATPWSQSFLIRRIQDPEWAPVFADDRVIMFARRGGANQTVIDQFELPKSMFSVNHQPPTTNQ